jgi:DNA invertase Pin-like site-specific DNA recombinase
MKEGDTLILSELTRAGRSLQAIISHVNHLTEKKINLISIKENLRIMNGEQDLQTKITVALFGLMGEVERDLISQRTKEGLAKAKANGRKAGRPKGSTGKSKLDGYEQEIMGYLNKGISQASIARLIEVSPTTLRAFIKSRNLKNTPLFK